MSQCSNTLTPTSSTFCQVLGEVDYTVLVDLKKLQDTKEPYFNATDIVKQYNAANSDNKKRLVDWQRSKRFKEIINIWECDFNTPKSRLIFKKRVGKVYETWIYKELFLSLMIWLDAKHEIAVTQFVSKVVEGTHLALDNRAETKSLSRPMTDQIKRLQVGLKEEGSEMGSKMIYVHINQWINLAMKNHTPRGGIDHDTVETDDEVLIGQLRSDIETLICESLDADISAYKTKAVVRDYLKGEHIIGNTLMKYLYRIGYLIKD